MRKNRGRKEGERRKEEKGFGEKIGGKRKEKKDRESRRERRGREGEQLHSK